MASERYLAAASSNLKSDGTVDGVLKVNLTDGFKVKARAIISSDTQPKLEVEIKAVLDRFTLLVGPLSSDMQERTDVSLYTVAANAKIDQAVQRKMSISPADVDRATYEEEPVVARRMIQVTREGNAFNAKGAGLVPPEYDRVFITRDLGGRITQTDFYLNDNLIKTLEFAYDGDANLIEVAEVK